MRRKVLIVGFKQVYTLSLNRLRGKSWYYTEFAGSYYRVYRRNGQFEIRLRDWNPGHRIGCGWLTSQISK